MVIGVLTSGNLGLSTLIQIASKFEIGFVLTDRGSDKIIDFCKLKDIPIFKGNPRNGKAYDFIRKIEVDIIASINYLFLIKKDIIQHSNKLTFNIHGSLLPKYRGRTPHVWAIINNEKNTGISAHKIDEGCDTGDVISQIDVRIDEFDTGKSILEKFKEQYFNIVLEVVNKCEENNLSCKRQNEKFATHFGKRTPEDGEINWDWQKERIKNWVRAQSYPYPGAFSFFNNVKIIIDEVKFSSLGYNNEMENGIILENSPNIVIKTPNGALELTKLRASIKLKVGDKII